MYGIYSLGREQIWRHVDVCCYLSKSQIWESIFDGYELFFFFFFPPGTVTNKCGIYIRNQVIVPINNNISTRISCIPVTLRLNLQHTLNVYILPK